MRIGIRKISRIVAIYSAGLYQTPCLAWISPGVREGTDCILNADTARLQVGIPTVITVASCFAGISDGRALSLFLHFFGAIVTAIRQDPTLSEHARQKRVHGKAFNRASGMVPPQASHNPYSPAFRRASASSISFRSRRSRSMVERSRCVARFRLASAPSSSSCGRQDKDAPVWRLIQS